jgi:hypothetical protein
MFAHLRIFQSPARHLMATRVSHHLAVYYTDLGRAIGGKCLQIPVRP